MLERFYARLALRLYPWRAPLWFAGLGACAAFAYAVLGPAGDADVPVMVLSVAVALWILGLQTVAHAFVVPLPPLEAGAGWFERLRWRLARGVRVVMAWVMTALAATVLIATLRAVLVVAREMGG